MNAIDLLKADHDRVEELFKRFKKNEGGSHATLFKQIRNELETHTHIEEAIFYPAALKRGKADLKKIVREGLEEHAQVKNLLADLDEMTPRNKQFNAKLTVVVENVEHHVEEEEDEMFPLAEDQFTDTQLDKLGAEMEAEKIRFQKKHGIKPSPKQKAADASVVDKAMEFVSEIFTGPSDKRPKQQRASRRRTVTPKTGGRSHTSGKANGKENGKSNGKTRTTRTGSSAKKRPTARGRSTSARTSR